MTEDELHDRAVALYNEERRVGWDPAWVNAHPQVREKYEFRVLEEEMCDDRDD